MKETTELTPAKYKLEGPIVSRRVMHRRDFGIETPLLSSILNDSFDRAFDDYVRCIGNSNYENNSQQRRAND